MYFCVGEQLLTENTDRSNCVIQVTVVTEHCVIEIFNKNDSFGTVGLHTGHDSIAC